MTRRLQRFLAIVLLVSPSTLFALGLGDIQLHSALNEPLDADIELVSAAPDELSSLKATLANRETFARYGLERPASLQDLEFRVTRSNDGRNVLKVRSREPITEPFMSFLVEVSWSRGRLLREYTLLMDPPIYMPGTEQATSAPVSAPQAGATQTERSGQVQRPAEPAPRPAEPAAVSRTTTPSPAPAAIDGSSYTVRDNDTLWQIASSLKPGAATGINRMMMALYRANPEAFAGNINQLRSGAILRIPADAEFDAIDTGEANAEVRRQYSEWRASRGLVAEGETPSEARLRLVTPTEGGEGTAAPAPGATAEAQQLRDRVRQLETQLDDSRRMIEVKDKELADLQRQVGQQPVPAPEQPPVAEPAPAEPQAAAPEGTPAEAVPPPAEEPIPAQEPEAAPPPVAEPEPTPTPVAEEAPARASWIDWLLEHWYYAGAALLVIGLILFALTRRRQEPDFGNFGKLADAARTGGGGGGAVVAREPRIEREPVTTPLRAAKQVDDAFLVEESGEHLQPKFKAAVEPAAPRAEKPRPEPVRGKSADDTLSSETAINLDQGDPLAEADFHMAYGLYDQAADLVRIAIEREPQRRDLKLKLLEIYFVWGNKDAFLQQARELADSRSQAAPGEWDKIAIMGRQISPDDPMFAQGAVPSGGAAADVDLNLEGGENRVDLDLLGSPEGEHAGAIDLDLGHEDTATTGESPVLREGEVGLDFVLDKPGRGSDGSATTREMAARTMETPTIETEYHGGRDSPTIESPSIRQRESTTIRERLSAAMRESVPPDQTAELALDDLGLELDQLPDAEQAALEETDHPGDAPTMLAGLDEKSRRALEEAESRPRSSRDEPTLRSTTLTGEEKISPTGTWVLDDKTLAATMALPGSDRNESTAARVRALAGAAGAAASSGDGSADTARRRRAETEATAEIARRKDTESTAELAGLSGEEMDLDLDRLEAALQSDTIKHPRKGTSADQFSDDVFGTDTATDLDLDVGEVKHDMDREPTSTARIPADEMGLPELEPVTMSEVGTKLDLARAYMDMGDPEGARSILEEVLQEGSATQKQEAQRLIDSLPG
jgi:pilus assembly protein FimV